jgi:ribokinase
VSRRVSVAVFGSLNYDISVWVPWSLRPDETVVATRLEGFCGGKGANQAVAAARLGATVAMIGCVGRDAHGDTIVDALRDDGIDVTYVHRVDGPTGAAFPIVSPENVSIVIAPGANASTGVEHADAAADVLRRADVLLLQGEVATDGARRAAELVQASGGQVVFNPAPVDRAMADVLVPLSSAIVLNQHEAGELDLAADVPTVVTRGAGGACVGETVIRAHEVDVVDPTGAGDAFCAAFAVALAEGTDAVGSARFANAAGALAVQVAGAQPSMPTRAAVRALLGDRARAGPTR